MKNILLFSIVSATFLNANTTSLEDQSGALDITIYNNNLGFVKQVKKFTLKNAGENYLSYEGVANSIIIDSVIPKFSKASTALYSQSFQSNNVNYESILEYYKIHNLDINYFEATKDSLTRKISKGKIVSNVENLMTIKNPDGKIHSVNIKDIFFDTLPAELSKTKPSIAWRIHSKAGEQSVNLKYLMNDIGWNANYTLDLKEDRANLQAWITINNNTGISFEHANIHCLAGEVNKVKKVRRAVRYKKSVSSAMMAMDAPSREVKEQSLSGYHLYTIPFKETIDKGSKQISFIDKPNIFYKSIAVLNTTFPTYALSSEQKHSFSHVINIKNEKENTLGIALPQGVIRVFSKDEDDKTHFIGENSLSPLSSKEDIKITIGKFFDIKAKVKQTHFESKNTKITRYLSSRIETTITNEDKKDRTIHINQRHQAYGDYSLTTTCKDICTQVKISPTVNRYIIKLKAGEEYMFEDSYMINKTKQGNL